MYKRNVWYKIIYMFLETRSSLLASDTQVLCAQRTISVFFVPALPSASWSPCSCSQLLLKHKPCVWSLCQEENNPVEVCISQSEFLQELPVLWGSAANPGGDFRVVFLFVVASWVESETFQVLGKIKPILEKRIEVWECGTLSLWPSPHQWLLCLLDLEHLLKTELSCGLFVF